jgi:hypothetical protein
MLTRHQPAIIPNGFSLWQAQRDRRVTPVTHILEAAHARLPVWVGYRRRSGV